MTATRVRIVLTLIAIATPASAQQAAPDVRRVQLQRDTVIDGIPCAPTGRAYAEFFARGNRLAECPLSVDHVIAGHRLPAGTWIIRHPDGRLRMAWLSRDTRIGPVVCKGTGYKDWVTTFHDDGTLATCYLPEPATVDGIPCRAGTIWGELTGGVTVHLHPNGRLASCSLSRTVTIDGHRHRSRSRLSLDEQGRPLDE